MRKLRNLQDLRYEKTQLQLHSLQLENQIRHEFDGLKSTVIHPLRRENPLLKGLLSESVFVIGKRVIKWLLK